jgi:energy-coupling factor transporter ATP-binding protein EcfA2
MAEVVFQHVAKVYPDGTRAVDDVTLAIDDGEFVVFVGPSGSGKMTALRMVAGLDAITEGTTSIGDRVAGLDRSGGRVSRRRRRYRASPLLRPRYRTRDLCLRQGRSDHVRIPVRALPGDADRMVAQDRRLADASDVVTTEDVLSLAQALRETKRAHAVSLAELRQADVDPVEDWAVWYAEYLLGVR